MNDIDILKRGQSNPIHEYQACLQRILSKIQAGQGTIDSYVTSLYVNVIWSLDDKSVSVTNVLDKQLVLDVNQQLGGFMRNTRTLFSFDTQTTSSEITALIRQIFEALTARSTTTGTNSIRELFT
jgi:hypothetical protein